MALYFSETQARRNDFRAPDVFVVLDTQRRERKSWVVWEEDGRTPDLIIELVSESTEHVDRGIKMDVYARLVHVPIYVIYDPFSARLDVFALDAATLRYQAMKPDSRGRYWCGRLGVFLAVVAGTYRNIEAPWLRWFREDGTLIPSADERVAAAEARLSAAEARAADAEAELAKLRDKSSG